MKQWWMAVGLLGSVMLASGVALAAGEAQVDGEACGMVSTFFEGPETQYVYAARIGAVDGKNTLMEVQEHKLAPGKHELKVYEFIDAPELRVKARQRGYSKSLTVEVAPNKRYHIGAKFNDKKPYDRDEFWEPVVWDVTDVECKP